jgi:hypothetical protein
MIKLINILDEIRTLPKNKIPLRFLKSDFDRGKSSTYKILDMKGNNEVGFTRHDESMSTYVCQNTLEDFKDLIKYLDKKKIKYRDNGNFLLIKIDDFQFIK